MVRFDADHRAGAGRAGGASGRLQDDAAGIREARAATATRTADHRPASTLGSSSHCVASAQVRRSKRSRTSRQPSPARLGEPHVEELAIHLLT